jgi:hypothetical protein
MKKAVKTSALSVNDIDSLPLMQNLKKSIDLAKIEKDKDFARIMSESFAELTPGWRVDQLVNLVTEINRICRKFQDHGEWEAMQHQIEELMCVVGGQKIE